MSFTPGQSFRLLRDHGNQSFDPVGGVRHGLAAGSIGKLVLEVPAGQRGAHNDQEDAYVLEFDDEARSLAPSGELVVTAVSRRVSFGVEAFDPNSPDRLFELVR